MHIQTLIEVLDNLFRYRDYPDFIVNLLQACDQESDRRYKASYLEKTSGLLLCYSSEVNNIYTAAFPSDDLLEQFRQRDIFNALLIVKHPLDWEELGCGFIPISMTLEQELKHRRISVYCAHAAHDNFEIASPSRTLMLLLGLMPRQTLRDQQDRIFGYLAELDQPLDYHEFRLHLSATFDLPHMQERYAHSHIHRVAMIAGGGDNTSWLRIARDLDCDTYVTGILYFRGSVYAQKHNPEFITALQSTELNAFGISHYLSERQGSIVLADIVAQHCNLPAVFLPEVQKEAKIRAQWGINL